MSLSNAFPTPMAAALAAGLLLGLALLALRPGDRKSVRNALIWLGAAAAAAIAHDILEQLGANVAAAVASDFADVLAGLVLVRLATFFAFRVALPALRARPPKIVEDLATAALFVAWGLLWLRVSAGIEPASLFATSAVITAVIAFSMQETLGNVLGGLLLQFDRSIRAGDWVRVEDATGRVAQIGWRHTAIETRNGETVVIPNGWLVRNRFTVIASRSDPASPWRRWVWVNIDLAAMPGTVCATLEEAVRDASIPNVLADPPPNAVLMEIGPRYGRYALRYWVADREPDDPTDSLVRSHILAALARRGMKLGVPFQEDLWVSDDEAHREFERSLERRRRVAALSGVELFGALSESERESLADHLVYAPFAAGDVMTRQGAVAHWLYLIVSGRADVWLETASHRTHVGSLESGDMFGEMGMMTGAPRRATVTARNDVVCYRLDKAGFERVLKARPDVAASISRVLAARAAELQGARDIAGDAPAPPRHEDILARIRKFFGLEGSAVRQSRVS